MNSSIDTSAECIRMTSINYKQRNVMSQKSQCCFINFMPLLQTVSDRYSFVYILDADMTILFQLSRTFGQGVFLPSCFQEQVL